MSASFGDVGRLQLAGYASAATGILRSRIHPLVPVAAIDVLAVALALGAMNIVGTMVGGHRENPFMGDIGRTKDDAALFAVVAPEPPSSDRTSKVAPTAIALAAIPDVELLFGAPVLIGGPFEAGQGDTVRFVSLEGGSGSSGPVAGAGQPPPAEVAEFEDPIPDASDDPSSPPLAKILSIAGRTQARALELASRVTAPVIEAADGGVDLVVLEKYSTDNAGAAVGATIAGSTTAKTTVATVAAPVAASVAAAPSASTTAVATVAAPVQAVAAPVQQVAQTVTQPVTNTVSVVGGLLN